MRKNYGTKGFTLGEIMVGIAIFSVIALGVSNINFSRLSQNQEIEIETVKIINIFEQAKNNALIGRGVEAALNTPDSWTVEIDSSSGSIVSYWTLGATTGSGSSWDARTPFQITDLHCETIDGSSEDTSTDPIASIIYNGSNGELIGCGDDSYKRIVFSFGIPGRIKEISINAVTGVIEVD